MKLKNPLFVVTDLERSVAFYKEVLGLRKIMDFGANVTLTGGLALQTRESWMQFIDAASDTLHWGGRVSELYFEEDNFDAFLARLDGLTLRYVHPVREHAWGQRVVRFYDPDGHIIEVGESLNKVAKRFRDSGLNEEGVARRMDISLEYARELLK